MKNTDFSRLWLGTTASGLATWAMPFVLGLGLIHQDLTATTLGLLLATRTAGFIVAVPVGGVLADRIGTIAVIRASGCLAAAASPVLAFSMSSQVWLAAIAAAVMGIGQGACRPAFQAHVPRVVEPEGRQKANAYITLAVRVTTLLAPAVTVLLSRFMSPSWLVLLIGACWLVAGLAPTHGTQPPLVREPRRLVADISDGVAEAGRHRWFIAGLTALVPIIAFGYSATNVVLPVMSREVYGGDLVFTMSTAAYTAGALAGAVLMSRWHPRNEGWVSFFGIGLYSLAPLVLLIQPHPAVIVATYVVIGVGMELFNVPWFTATQREVAPDKLARVSSVDFLISYGLAPLGLAIYPWLVQTYGTGAVLGVTAVVCMVAPLMAALTPGARRYSDPRLVRVG